MKDEKLNINSIDFKELKKNLFPLMKLFKKINKGKKKGLNSNDDIKNIRKKIEFLTRNSNILLHEKYKFLYASLCLLQIQNNSYLNELKNSNKKKRLRSEEENGEDEGEEQEKDNSIKTNKKGKFDSNVKEKNNNNNNNNNNLKQGVAENDDILENIILKNSKKKKTKKKNSNPEVENIKHLIDVTEFVKYCKQKPFKNNTLFPTLPLKSSEEDSLSLFSRLEDATDEKMEDILNNYTTRNKEFYNKCWEDLQKIKELENEDEDEDEDDEDDERDISHSKIIDENLDYSDKQKKGKGKEKETDDDINNDDSQDQNIKKNKDKDKDKDKNKNKNQDMDMDELFLNDFLLSSSSDDDDDVEGQFGTYTDYIPNQVYRSRIWTDGIMDRFQHLMKEKDEEMKQKPKRIKVCTECISKFHNILDYIPCSGQTPCERCKRLGLICYYPFVKRVNNTRNRFGNLYRLKTNVNNPMTQQEYNERLETEEENNNNNRYDDGGDGVENRTTTYKKLLNDAHIIGDREDYLNYKENVKFNYWTKNNKKNNLISNHLKSQFESYQKEIEKEQENIKNGKKPFLGKSNSKIPTSELLDALHYCVSKRSSLEKQNENMIYKYNSSALITLGILYEEIIKYEVEKFNKPGYYQ
ncbi:hypothetical protein BCR32DRAFT_264939 [Anaeromyces robustus]|uniref:Uncharacterized protein n=1 Tax=Anaeromyces robustus TaxID=1754192 RepID=A0A1Y1XKW3_9FUNG|nr:hypothetical protein BCR32DRAFT_264939 [Anaeromyces robustus]|eukprot:ORX86400.1 hypothetical protein BCR32DRAFT_264939 [Anaeromyces robustus]